MDFYTTPINHSNALKNIIKNHFQNLNHNFPKIPEQSPTLEPTKHTQKLKLLFKYYCLHNFNLALRLHLKTTYSQ